MQWVIRAAPDLIADTLHGVALAIHCSGDDFRPDVNDMKMPLALYLNRPMLASDSEKKNKAFGMG
jgi:hypothetical protein